MYPYVVLQLRCRQILNHEVHNDSPNQRVLGCAQEGRLGVPSEGLWVSAETHESIQLTARGEVRLVSRERSQVAESEPPTEPLREVAEPLVLLPGRLQ